MNTKQRAYRLLWRARDLAADDITQFVLSGSLSGWMGTLWEQFSAAEKDEVWKAGPATAEEVNNGPEPEKPEQAPDPGGSPAHAEGAAGARGEPEAGDGS